MPLGINVFFSLLNLRHTFAFSFINLESNQISNFHDQFKVMAIYIRLGKKVDFVRGDFVRWWS